MSGCLIFVRGYLVLGAIFNMAIAVACFIVATYIKNMNKDLLVVDQLKNSQKAIYIAIYVMGGMSIITGISSIIGFFKRNRCLQAKFIFLNFIYFLIFGAIFAVNVYGRSYINDQLSTSNCTTGPLKSANDVFNQSKSLWCQTVTISGTTVGCPCNIKDTTQWSAADQVTLLTKNGINPTGTTDIESCTQFQTKFSSYSSETSFLKLIENTFDCTGICDGDIMYYFSDVNRGPTGTSQGCFLQIRDKILNWLSLCYIYSIIAAAITLANVIFAFIHCCIGNKQEDPRYNQVRNTTKN